MILTEVYQVEDNKITINLPDIFRNRKKLRITVNDVTDSKISKINALKKAAKDPLFLADIIEINNDFSAIEYENL